MMPCRLQVVLPPPERSLDCAAQNRRSARDDSRRPASACHPAGIPASPAPSSSCMSSRRRRDLSGSHDDAWHSPVHVIPPAALPHRCRPAPACHPDEGRISPGRTTSLCSTSGDAPPERSLDCAAHPRRSARDDSHTAHAEPLGVTVAVQPLHVIPAGSPASPAPPSPCMSSRRRRDLSGSHDDAVPPRKWCCPPERSLDCAAQTAAPLGMTVAVQTPACDPAGSPASPVPSSSCMSSRRRRDLSGSHDEPRCSQVVLPPRRDPSTARHTPRRSARDDSCNCALRAARDDKCRPASPYLPVRRSPCLPVYPFPLPSFDNHCCRSV